MIEIIDFLQSLSLWQNTAYDYVKSFLVFLGLIVLLKIFQRIILVKLKKIAEKTKTEFDDLLVDIAANLRPPFYLLLSLYFSVMVLRLSNNMLMVIKVFFVFVMVSEAIRAVERIVSYFVNLYFIKKSRNADDKEKRQVSSLVSLIQVGTKVMLWLLGLTVILSNLGVNVTSLIASLGIAGLAVALAMQNVLSDLFSSVSIYLDKPFSVGDTIMIGDKAGTVEKIGLKTTRIKTFGGEELIVPNKELTESQVHNYFRMEKRRAALTLDITYDLDPKKVPEVNEIIKKIISGQDNVDLSRCHFKDFGPYSLIFEAVYYVNSRDYATYMIIKEKINQAVFAEFTKKGIGFAYPTQTLYVKQVDKA